MKFNLIFSLTFWPTLAIIKVLLWAQSFELITITQRFVLSLVTLFQVSKKKERSILRILGMKNDIPFNFIIRNLCFSLSFACLCINSGLSSTTSSSLENILFKNFLILIYNNICKNNFVSIQRWLRLQ